MRPVHSVSYMDVLEMFFPDRKAIAYSSDYNGILWKEGAPVSKEELDLLRLSVLKQKYVDWVKECAETIRSEASNLVIGTDMPRMLRVYDIKREQSQAFMGRYSEGSPAEVAAYDAVANSLSEEHQAELRTRYPLLFWESIGTSVTLWSLAFAVLDQYDLSSSVLDPVLGLIEAVRRNKIAEYMAASTEAEVRAVSHPEWPTLESLQPI